MQGHSDVFRTSLAIKDQSIISPPPSLSLSLSLSYFTPLHSNLLHFLLSLFLSLSLLLSLSLTHTHSALFVSRYQFDCARRWRRGAGALEMTPPPRRNSVKKKNSVKLDRGRLAGHAFFCRSTRFEMRISFFKEEVFLFLVLSLAVGYRSLDSIGATLKRKTRQN